MCIYLDLYILLNTAVDYCLLAGVSRITGGAEKQTKLILAACIGGIYGGCCLIPGFQFLHNVLWRTVALVLMVWIAFGLHRSGLRKGGMFVVLCFAMGGAAAGVRTASIPILLLCTLGLLLLCRLVFGHQAGRTLVPVELQKGNVHLCLTALVDTGNTLRDPVSGRPVLVAGADIAGKLLGLGQEQLKNPLETMTAGVVPGLRLIPYHAVGQPEGLLLAVRCDRVRIQKRESDALVAFCPERISKQGTYQALAGGI